MVFNLNGFWQSLEKIEVNEEPLNLSRVASVLIAITDSIHNPKIILTQRASTMSTHSGQVAFPGGRWEVEDNSLSQTALREAQEEIALSPQDVVMKGRLRERQSLHGLMVYPFVAQVPETLRLVPDPVETESIFTVPLSFFLESEPQRIDKVERQGIRYQVPAWYFDNYEIWGLTAYFLQDMLKLMKEQMVVETAE